VQAQERCLLASKRLQRVLFIPLSNFNLPFLTAKRSEKGSVLARPWLAGCCAMLIGGLSGLAAPARAQSPVLNGSGPTNGPGQTQRAGPIPMQSHFEKSMRMSVNLVLVPVVVTDLKNRPVLNLEREDFAVSEDGRPQEVEYFATEDVPISVGLILDVSASMTSKFEMERAAVTEFFRNANQQDDYFAITFADQPKLAVTSTQSIDEIQSGLAQQTPNGYTALFDAILEGRDEMSSAPQRRKVLLIISDGGDNYSRHHLKQIRRLVQDSDVEVYAICLVGSGPFKTLEGAHGKKWLTEITDASGGQTIAVDSQEKIPEAAATISREMRSRYVLGYRPSAGRKSARRKIRVEITRRRTTRSGFHAYYKTGYRPSNLSLPSADKN
jgi:Ca-activated chloride channel homolog